MGEERREVYEEEIDLYELLLKLKRRWKLILGTVSVFLAGSLLYLLMAKPVYEASFIVSVNEKPDYKLSVIEEPDLILLISPEEVARAVKGMRLDVEGIKGVRARTERRMPRSVVVSVEAYSPDAVEKAYKEILSRLENLPAVKERLRLEKETLKKKISRLEKALEEMRKKKSILEEALRRGDLEKIQFNPLSLDREILQVEKELYDLRSLLEGLKAFEVTVEPSVPSAPAKPKKALVLSASLVSSLLLGVFLALFVDWFEEARRRHQGT